MEPPGMGVDLLDELSIIYCSSCYLTQIISHLKELLFGQTWMGLIFRSHWQIGVSVAGK